MKRFAIASLLGLSAVWWAPARADEKPPLVPSITVVGSGKATAAPDMAEVRVGVVTQADSAAKAVKDNTAAMDKLFQTLEARGVAKKDLQTSDFSVQPQYKPFQPGQTRQEIIGYQVSNQVRVTVRKLDTLGALLDGAVGGGANQMQGVSFSVADPNQALDDARRRAVADARRKADLYASEAGVEVGRVLLIQEETPRLPRPVFAGNARALEADAVPVAAGELDFRASITVTYAIGKGAPATAGK